MSSFYIAKVETNYGISLVLPPFFVEDLSFEVGRVAYAASNIPLILSFLSSNYFSISLRDMFGRVRYLPSTYEPDFIIF